MSVNTTLIVAIAYIVLGYSLWHFQKTGVLISGVVFNVLMIVFFLLVGGVAGIVASGIEIVRNVLFYYNERKQRENSVWLLVALACVVVFANAVLFTGITDVVMWIATFVGLYVYWYDKDFVGMRNKVVVLKAGQIVISICYIVYAFILSLWSQLPFESLVLMFTVLGFISAVKAQMSTE